MTPIQFRAFLSLLMASDPPPVNDMDDKILNNFADTESQKYGYDNWVHAYHEFDESTDTKALAE